VAKKRGKKEKKKTKEWVATSQTQRKCCTVIGCRPQRRREAESLVWGWVPVRGNEGKNEFSKEEMRRGGNGW